MNENDMPQVIDITMIMNPCPYAVKQVIINKN